MSIHALNWTDYFIIGVIVFSTLTSLMRGFISEAISLFTWIIATVLAFKFSGPISHLLSGLIHNPSVRLMVGFLFVLILILIIGSIMNHYLGVFIRNTGLSGTNRLLGMVFGFARGVLLVAIFILFARMTSMIRLQFWQSSQLIPYFLGLANWLQQFIPAHFTNMSHYLKPQSGKP